MGLPAKIVTLSAQALGLAPLLVACSEDADQAGSGSGLQQTLQSGDERGPGTGGPPGEGETQGVTPLEERVATIGLLNKRNNLSQDFRMRPGDVLEEGPVILRLATCERTAPWEMPQETGAFVQLDVLERGASEHTRVFSGWLFKQSPSLNVVEHPIYDVWVKDCAMSFPGEPSADG
ncbi:MAG: DUF2155 domain-containing protein [Pseudomonadota bacterium]